jgi:hypothetical protein
VAKGARKMSEIKNPDEYKKKVEDDINFFLGVLKKAVEQNRYMAICYNSETNRFSSIGNIPITEAVGLLEITKMDLIDATRNVIQYDVKGKPK